MKDESAQRFKDLQEEFKLYEAARKDPKQTSEQVKAGAPMLSLGTIIAAYVMYDGPDMYDSATATVCRSAERALSNGHGWLPEWLCHLACPHTTGSDTRLSIIFVGTP